MPGGERTLFGRFDFHPAYDTDVASSELPHKAGMREFARQLEEKGISIVTLAGAVAVNAAQLDQLRIF